MEEKRQLFRKQSLESISSPEKLNDYIKAAEPGIWAILIAILLVIIGACIWGIFGRLDTTVTVGAVSSNGELLMYISEDDKNIVENGMSVSVNGQEYIIEQLSDSPVLLGEEADAYAIHTSSLEKGDFSYIASASTDLPDGSYKAVITIESVPPIFFITN